MSAMAEADSGVPAREFGQRKVPRLVGRTNGKFTTWVMARSDQAFRRPLYARAGVKAARSTSPGGASTCSRRSHSSSPRGGQARADATKERVPAVLLPGPGAKETANPCAAPRTPSTDSQTLSSDSDNSEDCSSVAKRGKMIHPANHAYAAWPTWGWPTSAYDHWHYPGQPGILQRPSMSEEAWFEYAKEKAKQRGAPRDDEVCPVGCVCKRCVGLPLAHQLPRADSEMATTMPWVQGMPDGRSVSPMTMSSARGRRSRSSGSSTGKRSSSSSSSRSGSPPSNNAATDVLSVEVPQSSLMAKSPCAPKRLDLHPDCQVFCSNLSCREVTAEDLRQAFEQRFQALPAFQDHYLKSGVVSYAVMQVNIVFKRNVMGKTQSKGDCAFVTLADRRLASTALLFAGFELCGKQVLVHRPRSYVSPNDGCQPPYDVTQLRRLGLLPREAAAQCDEESKPHRTARLSRGADLLPRPPSPVSGGISGRSCTAASLVPGPGASLAGSHIFIGNLDAGEDSLQDVAELIHCTCSELPEYRPELGPAMVDAYPADGRSGWIVVLQSVEVAQAAQAVLRKAVLRNQSLKVGSKGARNRQGWTWQREANSFELGSPANLL
eukprot:TRINITY_DN26044_c0_g2_i1.p1 TRINITY_DN26044_c0_g2~~TRINITY_DN26044_c0_g2_i1.p1  ORF type:complete len:607 (+),score=94.70 TRINITY_DN26044_c0_g2_i1:61-1881(+)